jgi:cyclin B
MRAKLVGWVYSVHSKYSTSHDTIFSAVHIIDRFLAVESIEKNQLQLVGAAALVLASKFEGPAEKMLDVDEVPHLTKQLYTTNEAVKMEWRISSALNWKFNCPTTYDFVRNFLISTAQPTNIAKSSMYLCERMLQEYSLLEYGAPIIASAAICLSRGSFKLEPRWVSTRFFAVRCSALLLQTPSCRPH